MSSLHTQDKLISKNGFAGTLSARDVIVSVQSVSSTEDESTDGSSKASGHRGDSLREGDLITGFVDITNKRVYMVPGTGSEDRAGEEKDMGEYIISLQIIPQEYRDGWNLDHPSNTTWLSPLFYCHHEIYATILIAPCAEDSESIRVRLNSDNLKRVEHIVMHGYDPGRCQETDWFKTITGKYELIILHPPHFLVGGFPVVIKHPTTNRPTLFYTSSDGFLHEGNPAGPRLPPFSSRGDIDRDIPLNPILVNFAAEIRLRRLDRQSPGWMGKLHPDAQEVLANVKSLHRAVVYNRDRPSPPDLGPGPRCLPTIRWADAQKLIHTGFEELPDLDGDCNSRNRPDFGSDLGVMTNDEKITNFLSAS